MEYTSASIEDTFAIAEELASQLQGGEILALSGDLGAGKTSFTQGLAQALGVSDNVNSPTFVLMKIYDTKHDQIKKLVHIDAYRLKFDKELIAIGATDYLHRPDTLTVIEWPEKIESLLPPDCLHIKIKNLDAKTRLILIKK